MNALHKSVSPLVGLLTVLIVLLMMLAGNSAKAGEKSHPGVRTNILFIIIDDLNDMVGPLGNVKIKTPNLDRLAKQSTLFTHAYCAAPSCGPSRASLLSGLLPSTSGYYYNSQSIFSNQGTRQPDWTDLPSHFKHNGYTVGIYGKVFHERDNAKLSEIASPGKFFPHPGFWDKSPEDLGKSLTDFRYEGGSNFAWGSVPDDWEQSGQKLADTRIADQVIEDFGKIEQTPFFFSVGFIRPHLPWIVPQRFYDIYPLSEIELPDGYKEDDLDDLPECAKWLAQQIPGIHVSEGYLHREILKKGAFKNAIQAYQASVTFMDYQLGRVIDALQNSSFAENTVIVVTSDHGYHLGEKDHWTKFGLWEQSNRIPLLISLPGQLPKTATTPVSLIDLYPTLIELAGLGPPVQELDGVDLLPVLKGLKSRRGAPVLSTYGYKNHSLRDESFRYIGYRNGEEELYNHQIDPHELNNLATSTECSAILVDFRRQLPKTNTVERDTGGSLGWDPKVFERGFRYQEDSLSKNLNPVKPEEE